MKWEDALKRSVKVDGKEVPLLKYVREHGIYQVRRPACTAKRL